MADIHVLLVDYDDGNCEPPVPFGPFHTVEEAQSFAEDFREANGLSREVTPDNNEAWTNAGWYFGIFPLKDRVEQWH